MGVAPLRAQSTAWSSQLIVPAFPSPFLSEWERNPQNLALSVAYFGTDVAEFRIEGIVRGGGRGELARAISPTLTAAAGPTTEVFTGEDLFAWDVRVQETRARQVLSTGTLPEGDYEICARVLSLAGIQLTEACSFFSVALPSAPQLLSPELGGGIPAFQPVFQWTPVNVPPDLGVSYRVVFVPVLPGQTPFTALRANLPMHEEVTEVPVLVYPVDAIELRDGERYAWRVEALDGLGDPLIPGGLYSEVWTFTATTNRSGGPWTDEGGLPTSISLVPGLAELIDLGAVDWESTPTGWILNGPAWMSLAGEYGTRARVRLEDLEVEQFAGTVTIRGGAARARLTTPLPIPSPLPIAITELVFEPLSGLMASAQVTLPGNRTVPLEGDLRVTSAGLYGRLTAANVWSGGADPVDLSLSTLEVRLPGGEMSATGSARLLGGLATCDALTARIAADGTWSATPLCAASESATMTTSLNAHVGIVRGTLGADLRAGTLTYALDAATRIAIAPEATSCAARFEARLRSESGVTIEDLDARCDASRAKVEMPWVHFGLSQLQVSDVSYEPGAGFGLAATVVVAPLLPSFDALSLPVLRNVRLDASGLTFPAASLLPNQMGLDLAGYGLRVGNVRTAAATIPWTDWNAGTVVGFRVDFDAGLSFPRSAQTFPSCLALAPPRITRGRIADGAVVLDVDGSARAGDECRVPLVAAEGSGAEVIVEGWAGPVEVSLNDGVTLQRGLGLRGALSLAAPFTCGVAGLPVSVDGALTLQPNGALAGDVTLPAGACAVQIAGVTLALTAGRVTVGEANSATPATLTAGASVVDSVAGIARAAAGSLTLDLLTGAVVRGSLVLDGPFRYAYPVTDPLLTFTLQRAELSARGLAVDGRHALALPGGATVDVTFDGVLVRADGAGLAAGRVLFDLAFGLEGGIGEGGAVQWRAVAADAPLAVERGFRVELPAQTVLDARGVGIAGEGRARLIYGERDFVALTGLFRNNFALGNAPVAVREGNLDLMEDGRRIAYVDASGFHADLGIVAEALIPSRLGLPTESVAYLELRDDDGALRVVEEEHPLGRRIYTPEGVTLPLVLPAFALDGGAAPVAQVSVDLVVAAGVVPSVIGGAVTAVVDPNVDVAFDLSRHAVPFRLRTLTYANPDGQGARWRLDGEPTVLGAPVEGATATLELTANSRLVGTLDLPYVATRTLVPNSDALRFTHQRLRGSFDVGLPEASGNWSLQLDGTLVVDLDGRGGATAAATLESTPLGLAFVSVDASAEAAPVFVDLGVAELGIANLRVPTLSYDDATGWVFAIDFDGRVRVPRLGGVLSAEIPALRLTREGLTLPAIELTEFAGELNLAGFRITPLALRTPELQFNPFADGLSVSWTPRVDLAIAFDDSASTRWPALQGFRLSALDLALGIDGVSGAIEPRTLLNGLDFSLAPNGLGLRLDAFGGAFTLVEGVQGIDVQGSGSLVLPEALRCAAAPDAALVVPQASLALSSSMHVRGNITDVAVACPLQLGPLRVTLVDASLIFDVGTSGQMVDVAASALLTLPGTQPNTTVSATGALEVSLLEPRVRSGSIAVNERFTWQVPAEDPFLTMTVERAVLDSRGFVLDGSGAAVLADGSAGPVVSFAGLTFDTRGDIVDGRATIAAGVLLDATLDGGAVSWSLGSSTAGPLTGNGLRLGLGGAVTLDADGLGLAGLATAQLRFADSSFTGLAVDFRDGFTLATREARVAAGRAGFLRNANEIAFVDTRGFFPGDLFGVLPLPNRIPLPGEDVAYLQVRDAQTGVPLVQTANVAGGLSLATAPNATVSLVLPGLLTANGNPTTLPVQFSLVVNPASYAVVSGAIDVAAPEDGALFDLQAVGLALGATRLQYNPAVNASPRVDLRVRLPEALNTLDVRFTGLALARDGFRGEAVVGTMDNTATGPSVASVTLGEITTAVRGARAVFGAQPSLTLAGEFRSPLIVDASGTSARIGFTGTVSAEGALAVTADVGSMPNGRVPIGDASFQLQAVGTRPAIAVFSQAQEFAVELSGILALPSLGEAFALTIEGLSIGTRGITLPSVAMSVPAAWQQFDLFGARFTLRDTDAGPGIALGLDNRVLVLTMGGDLELLGRTVAFEQLQIGTDGRLGMGSAALVDTAVSLVPNAVSLTRVAVRQRRLEASLAIDLPRPFEGVGTQTLTLAIATDGTVTGGGSVTLLDEAAGLGGERTQFSVGIGTAHLRYLGLRLGSSVRSAGQVEVVGDLYLGQEAENRIQIGERLNQSLTPGLVLAFDGTTTWGNVTLARTFDFDLEMLQLSVSQVSSVPSQDGLAIGLAGLLQVRVPAVTGGVNFTGFRLTPQMALETADASVNGGTLTIGGVLSLSLSQFAYTSTPTTVSGIRVGSLPTAESPTATSSTVDLSVTSLLTFGGTLSVGSGCGSGGECLFSGGVERFLFYRTPPEEGSETHLVIQRANLSVASALTVEADLRYRASGATGGFELVIGGRADFRALEVAVVGAIEQGDSERMRAGLFLLASGRLDLVPGVLLMTEIGGGFFYNPRPEYCQLVRQYSGMSTLSSNGSSCEQSTSFTGFLYGAAEIVERNIGRGQVLLTVSDRGLRIDGQMALLSPGSAPVSEARIRGTVELAIGFTEFFAEGEIALEVRFDPLLTVGGGSTPARVGFYVYGSDSWGVYGSLPVSFLRLIHGNAEFLVGPPGFYIEGSIRAGFDFWIVSVEGDATTAVWYASGGWGAYLDVGVKASILGGSISAEARLRGALVSPPNASVLLYASALAEGCLLGLCESAEIWAKFENGGVDGGFGKNGAFDRVIAEARRAKASFDAERAAMEGSIQTAQLLAGLALSESELAEMYARIREESLGDVFTNAIQREYVVYTPSVRATFPSFDTNPWWLTEKGYYEWYRGLVEQAGSPQVTQTPTIESYADRVREGVQALQLNRSIVQYKLAQSMEDIEALAEAAALEDLGEQPIRSVSFAPPQTVDNGDGTRTLVSGPSVDIDEAAASAMRSELIARQARTDTYAREVSRRIEQIEAGLAWANFVLLDTAMTAPLGFARAYATVLQDVSEQYARHGDLMLRQQDWFAARLRELTVTRQPDIQAYLHRKSQLLLQNAANPEQALQDLITTRTEVLDALAPRARLTETFLQNVSGIGDVTPGVAQSYKDVADSVGKQLWFDLARVGMTTANVRAGAMFDSIRVRADTELRQRWQEHSALTMDIHRAMQARADLMASLHDLYAEFGRSYPSQPTVTRTLSFDAATNPLLTQAIGAGAALQAALTVIARQQTLEREFTVPSVNHVVAVSQNLGYMAKETYWWEAAHPTRIHEYVFNSLPGANIGFLGMTGMQSNGAANVRDGYLLTPGRGTTSIDRTLRVGARGGAGYVGFARANYQTRFEGGGGQQPVGQGIAWGRTVDVTPPSTPSVRIGGHLSTTQTYWTSRADQIDSVRWSAIDLESGIGGYEVAIGTASDTTAVRDWTDVGGRTSVLLLDLTLSPSEVAGYRVFVRARNGDGLVGMVGRSAPIRVDLAPPTYADTARIRRHIVYTSFSMPVLSSPSVDPIFAAAGALCPLPPPAMASYTQMMVPYTFTVLPLAATPAITLRLPQASDAESGVARYAWRLATEPAESYTSAGWTLTSGVPDTVRISGAPLSYSDSLHVSVVAIDRAGLASAPIHFGPFVAPDQTPPAGANFCATIGSSVTRIRLRVSDVGRDVESGVVRWDYRVRRADGSVVRNWPIAPDRSSLSAGTTIETSALRVVQGDRLYVEMRTTNGAGLSTITASGPFDVWTSPPAAPAIQSVSAFRSGRLLVLRTRARTVANPDVVHRWMLRDASGVVAYGTMPGTGGVYATQDFSVFRPDGSSVPAGTYTLAIVTITPTGISGAEGTSMVVVP